jgi:ethanolamine utilization protein EutM
MEKRSLGLIETWGYAPAVEAADAGAKSANVTLVGYERTEAGLITVKFVGDVAAVKTAVSAGAAAAARVGKVVAVHVIPRPDRQMELAVTPGPLPPESRVAVTPAPPEMGGAPETPPAAKKTKGLAGRGERAADRGLDHGEISTRRLEQAAPKAERIAGRPAPRPAAKGGGKGKAESLRRRRSPRKKG